MASDQVEKMTHKEHAARAMLMGLVYDWRDRTYGVDRGESSPGFIHPIGEFDERYSYIINADTLEKIYGRDYNPNFLNGKDWKVFPDE